jgi:hypothetical protein
MWKRLKEPSTWAAIGILVQMARPFIPAQWHAIPDGVSALAAVYAGVTPEGAAVAP